MSWFGKAWMTGKLLVGKAKFDDGPLRTAIDRVVVENGLDDSDRTSKGAAALQHPKAGKLLMCATLAEKGESILFRSYDRPKDAKPVTGRVDTFIDEVDSIDIGTAARATSAAPTYLPQVLFPEGKTPKAEQLVFWDGGLLNNNPIDQLWNARYDLVGQIDPPPPVALVLSFGCSWDQKKSGYLFSLVNTLSKASAFMTNTEAKNRDFQRYVNVISGRGDVNDKVVYRRLNVPTDQEEFDLADFTKMPRLCELTKQYLKGEEAPQRIEDVVKVLARFP